MPVFDLEPHIIVVRDMASRTNQRVFLVGGGVRDFLLGRLPMDFDFAVDKDAVALARRFSRRIKGAFVLLDEEHGTARVVKSSDGQTKTYDFTDWRGRSIREDLKGRDFTINAMAVDLQDPGDIIEVKGSRRDLKTGVIRMVSPRAFTEDPLRLLRAYALQAGFGFKISATTQQRIKKDSHLLLLPAMERVREELFKVLESPRAFATLTAMDRDGVLSLVLPQITVMYGVKQGGYHHLDVWKHSLEVAHQLEELLPEFRREAETAAYLAQDIGGGHSRAALLTMAALLHDIGKPETRRKEVGRMTFHGHEHAGERITRLAARHLKLSAKERYFLEDMVRMHLRPGYLSNMQRPSEKSIFRYLRDAKQEAAALAMLAMADQKATRGPLTTMAKHQHHEKICRMLISRYFAVRQEKPRVRLLTGHDLIRKLKLKPSPLFGKILTDVQEAAALGKLTTKDQALALARQMVKA